MPSKLKKFRIFVVEDEPLLREMLGMALVGKYDVVSLESAEACLERLQSVRPGLFLLDISLPGMDGLDLCRKIKADSECAEIPVIFISGLDDIEARLASYDAGGEDFICKPFEPTELLRKVQRAQLFIEEKHRLREMTGYAQKTAFIAMSGMSELGVVIEFMRKSFACSDNLDLARLVLDALGQFGLDGAVQVRTGTNEISLSPEGRNLPLETAILNHVRAQGRIFEFKSRGVYNYGGITILVKNMPLEDAERCGRLRDDLAILAEGADARREAIELELQSRQTKDGIGSALAMLHSALVGLQANHAKEQNQTAVLMSEMQQSLVKTFVSLGLTESQEAELEELIRHYFGRLRDHNEYGDVIAARLGDMAEQLKVLI